MKRLIIIFLALLLWVSQASAQVVHETPFEASISGGYRVILQEGSVRSSEYDYLHSSAAGSAFIEWASLPHRFRLESFVIGEKDHFAEAGYSFGDYIMVSATSRGLFHNMDRYSVYDDPATLSPVFMDRNPWGDYGTENTMRGYFIRLKTPDFPFHLYAEAKTIEKKGTIQQRFRDAYSGALIKTVSQSRRIDWDTREFRVGANTHFGPLEFDYSHAEKRFEAGGEKALSDSFSSVSYPHNIIPNITSSSDVLKVHTSHAGRVVAAGTYSSGEKTNTDSNSSAVYRNASGDLTLMPWTSLILAVKYRRYDLDARNIDTVTVVAGGTNTYPVRDSISSTRDVVSGILKFRPVSWFSLKAEYVFDSTERDTWNIPSYQGEIPRRTTKGIVRIGAALPVSRKFTLKADYSKMNVEDPAYNTDPDKSETARAMLVWTPGPRSNVILSYGAARDTRENLLPPLTGGGRDAARDQGLASFTVALGKRASVTAGYSYYKNSMDYALTYQDGAGARIAEPGVPYDDIAHVGMLSLGYSIMDGVMFTADGAKSFIRGRFRNIGDALQNTSGIAEASDLRARKSSYSAGMEVQYEKNLGYELRYQYKKHDDLLDDSQDGKTQAGIVTVSLKW